MTTMKHDRPAPLRHECLLLSPPDLVHPLVNAWTRTALARRHRILCLSESFDLLTDAPDVVASPLTIRDLQSPADPARLVGSALDDGFDGASILISADSVIAATSSEVHATVEATLAELRARYPVAVLCCYDRNGAGVEHLDMAVGHHPGGLHEQQLTLYRPDGMVQLRGEIDMANLDVFAAALRAATRTRPATIRIDLRQVTFVSAGAARTLDHHTALFRDQGGQVELHGVTPHLAGILQLINPQPLPGLKIFGSGG